MRREERAETDDGNFAPPEYGAQFGDLGNCHSNKTSAEDKGKQKNFAECRQNNPSARQHCASDHKTILRISKWTSKQLI